MRPAWIIALGLALGLPAACAHDVQAPGATVSAFGAALARGDLRGAYQLTSAEFQRRMPFQAFAAGFAGAGAETAALGRRMVAEAPALPPRVDIRLSLGEGVPLVLEDGRWRIDGPVYEAWGQGTPRAALRTFIRARDARRYDVVLRLVPDRYRAALTVDRLREFWEGAKKDKHRAMLERIRAAVSGPLTETGDEARLVVPPDREVVLWREGGVWKIADPDAE